MDLYSLWDTHVRFLKSKTIMLHSLSAILCSRRLVNFKGKDCVSHMLQHLAEMDEGTWTMSLPLHHLHKAWSVVGISNTGEVGIPHGG